MLLIHLELVTTKCANWLLTKIAFKPLMSFWQYANNLGFIDVDKSALAFLREISIFKHNGLSKCMFPGTDLWLYRLILWRPYLESAPPLDTGSDSRLAISRFMEDFSSSMYRDSISFSTNLGISFRFYKDWNSWSTI